MSTIIFNVYSQPEEVHILVNGVTFLFRVDAEWNSDNWRNYMFCLARMFDWI
jgi:hypothetical protein